MTENAKKNNAAVPKKYSKNELSQLPFMNYEISIDERVGNLLSLLTLNEKFRLLSGHKMWTTKSIKRLGIPEFGMSDGPNGVAFHSSYKKNTYFPTSICVASTWNRKLPYKYGIAIGEETRAAGRHMILAPGINIDRSPLNGRTFEYLTEDPYLNKEMAKPYVKGVQSQRISVCVKHYVANNQETKRFTVSSEVSKRALEEIYLRAFKDVVINADPWSVMACYNKVNGVYGCEHKELLRDTLMDKFGFDGFVVSDWFATRHIEATESCVKAGLTLEMPKQIKYKISELRKAYDSGKFQEDDIDFLIKRLLRVMFKVGIFDPKENLPKGSRNTEEHKNLARKIAEEGIVLLKNENNILPLDMNRINVIGVLGPNAKKKIGRPFYGGSSAVWPPYEITPFQGIAEKCEGKVIISEDTGAADVVIVVVGLDHGAHQDAEGMDRKQLELPKKQVDLIKSIAKTHSNTIVVMVNGSPIAMDEWIQDVPVIVEAWYGGLEGGRALADIIFGDVCPSGKLPITFPKALSDSPAHVSERTFPGVNLKVHYDEGIFVGYRHFNKHNIDPLFPFGFGLSYTKFEYSNLTLDQNNISKHGKITLSVDIKNTGKMDGAEVVQLYLSDVECSEERPKIELKGFQKIFLKQGEYNTVDFELTEEDLAFYSDSRQEWIVESGEFEISIGKSSRDILLKSKIYYN